MSESEEYYRRKNREDDAVFVERMKILEARFRQESDDIIGSLEEFWKKEHLEELPESVYEWWIYQSAVATAFAYRAVSYGNVSGKVRRDLINVMPDKGTQARKDWDATKKRTAARKRKEAKEKAAREESARVKAEKVAELKAIDPLAVYGYQCPQGMRIRADDENIEPGDCVTHNPLGVEYVSVRTVTEFFIGCKTSRLRQHHMPCGGYVLTKEVKEQR